MCQQVQKPFARSIAWLSSHQILGSVFGGHEPQSAKILPLDIVTRYGKKCAASKSKRSSGGTVTLKRGGRGRNDGRILEDERGVQRVHCLRSFKFCPRGRSTILADFQMNHVSSTTDGAVFHKLLVGTLRKVD